MHPVAPILNNCGFNLPIVPSKPGAIVTKTITYLPSQLPATVYGNEEISCGNVYSTVWHVTAYADAETPVAGDQASGVVAFPLITETDYSRLQCSIGTKPERSHLL